MASTDFIDGSTVITAEWLNSIDDLRYKSPSQGGGAAALPLDSNRTQADKNSDLLSVFDFGVVGDGVTDDTVALQAAVDAAAAGKKRLLLAGANCKISRVTFKTGEHVLLGPGTITMYTLTSGFLGDSTNTPTSVTLHGITFDGSLYGLHYNDPQGMFAVLGKSGKWNIQSCTLINIYGGGFNVKGKSFIANNVMTDVAGFNETTDPGGEFDNYGDGIRVYGIESTGSVVMNNTMTTSRRGRAGIVVEFDPNRVSLISNEIAGYDRSIHLELCGRVISQGNKCSGGETGLLVSSAVVTSIGNHYGSGKAVLEGPYGYGAIYCYANYDGSSFTDDTVVQSGGTVAGAQFSTSAKDIQLRGCTITATTVTNAIVANGTSGAEANWSIENCTFNGTVEFNTAPPKSRFIGNKVNGKLRLLGATDGWVVESNIFTPKDATSNKLLEISNNIGGMIFRQNRFNVPNALVENYVVDSFNGTWARGRCYFSDNHILTTEAITAFFRYNSTGTHQPFIVDQLNYIANPTTGETTPLTFSSRYNLDGFSADVFYGNAAPTTGIWRRGDIVYNYNPAASGFIGWVCVTAGTPGTWKTFGAISA